jgi:tRNA threonylcarbamoyladenosine biosynthesis protein TsaE
MSDSQIDLLLADSSATEALGVALARAFRGANTGNAGEGSAVFYLHGDLGAGKTTCVRSLLRELGVEGPIRSPTYTLVEVYPLPDITCVHVDLYRVQGPLEVEELGLRDYFAGKCLLLVEWPERGGAALPRADVDMTLTYADDSRQCRLSGESTAGKNWLSDLVHDSSFTSYVSNLT